MNQQLYTKKRERKNIHVVRSLLLAYLRGSHYIIAIISAVLFIDFPTAAAAVCDLILLFCSCLQIESTE